MTKFEPNKALESRGYYTYEKSCGVCQGTGYTMYGSTSTWRGGIGGSAMTTDVCDNCWGSGIAGRPWPSHRKFDDMKRELEKKKK